MICYRTPLSRTLFGSSAIFVCFFLSGFRFTETSSFLLSPLSSSAIRPHCTTTLSSTTTPPQNITTTITAPYPTARGETVDARKIVALPAARTAILLRHCLLVSQALAEETLTRLRSEEVDFETLTQSLSACTLTRHDGGMIGWMSTLSTPSSKEADPNAHLDGILPADTRETLLHMVSTKPGDVVMLESTRGHHLLQIVDVMADVRSMSTKRYRGRKRRSLEDLKTYRMETMGCQMNEADSERMEGQLMNLGIRPAVDKEDPDIVILNTCSIRDRAEQKVYSHLGPHAKRKRETDDNVVLVVAGCVAQQEGRALLRRSPELDLVMGPQYANRLGDLLEDVMLGNQVVATAATHVMEDATKPRRGSTVCAWVNVIYGCNERCAFCIVPTTRGVEQSRPVESIVKEVKELVANGFAEVTLLGQNIDAYGRDMLPKKRFSSLMRTVGSIPGLKRLRFVTSHPRYMSLSVVDAVAETPAACESFHIPFQSGSNRILSEMGRGHTREKYLRIVDRIRSKIPDAAISADVIVGFPGETEADFQNTLDLMKEVVFDSVNTAAYSPRPGTPAATFPNQVDEDIKQERLQRINRLNLAHARERRARMLDREVEVLIEERNVKKPTQVMGRTRHGYIVYVEGDITTLRGELVKVKISTAETYYLVGEIVKET